MSKGRFNFQVTNIIRPLWNGQNWAKHCGKCSEMWPEALEQLESWNLDTGDYLDLCSSPPAAALLEGRVWSQAICLNTASAT